MPLLLSGRLRPYLGFLKKNLFFVMVLELLLLLLSCHDLTNDYLIRITSSIRIYGLFYVFI